MAATKIEIVIPNVAFEPGDLVSFEIVVTNKQQFVVYVEPVVPVTGATFAEQTIPEGGSASWPASFIMPDGSITIIAESWLESYPDFIWHKDSVAKFTIKPGQLAGTGGGGFPLGLLVAGGLLGVVVLAGKQKGG